MAEPNNKKDKIQEAVGNLKRYSDYAHGFLVIGDPEDILLRH